MSTTNRSDIPIQSSEASITKRSSEDYGSHDLESIGDEFSEQGAFQQKVNATTWRLLPSTDKNSLPDHLARYASYTIQVND